jgi:PAS domain S-box-containing protein
MDRAFADLLESTPDAMVCVDDQGRIAGVNAEAEKLFDYARADLAGQPIEILVPEGTRHPHAGHRDRYLACPRSRPMGAGKDLAGRRSDGSTFPAEISLSTIHTADGILIATAVRDLTERQQAAETASQLAAIVRSSPAAVLGQTLGGIITSWNPAAERLYGYRASEIIGQHICALIPPEDRDRELEILARVARGVRLEGHQAQRVRKDGSPVTVSLTLSPITGSTGKITGLSAVARSLTREREDPRFTGLLEAAPDAMICADGSGRIVLANAQAERLFGYSKEELTGQPVEILVPEAVRAEHPAHRAEYVASPRPRPMGAGMDLAGRCKDGSTFPAEISLSAIHTDQGILITAAVRDITERLESQAERERLTA